MDYKYIEQLLERYWAAETSLKEERILRTFFCQPELPAQLEQYRPLFACLQQEAAVALGDDFDQRMLAMTASHSPKPVRARTVSLRRQLRPLFRAAAAVAIVLSVGGALQHPWDARWNDPRDDYANTFVQQIDTADTVVPMQAENVFDAPTDSSRTISGTLHKE